VDSFKKQVDFRLAQESAGIGQRAARERDSKFKGGAPLPASTAPANRREQSRPPWTRDSSKKQKFDNKKFQRNQPRPRR
jgi:hypothetical protein